MKTSLDHLPEAKRRELDRVVELIRAGFAEAISRRTAPRFRNGKLLKIILFGSYARGDWVEDPVGRYFSDFDLLIVVNHEDLTDVPEFWAETEDRLLKALSDGEIRTPVSLIYHSLDDVNEKLRLGRYFFIDVLRDGILLFNEPGHAFAEPQPLSPAEALKETQDFYNEWFESAAYFFDSAKDAISKEKNKVAAFLLHQTVERLYQCLFLVRTLYMPKTHNLNRLRALAEDIEPTLKDVWPTGEREHKRAYARLREAYIKARYSREYRITDDQLHWLRDRTAVLQDLIREACIVRINVLTEAA
jgi:predicted nucleotidyltransferase/HEPN domain-containing protein